MFENLKSSIFINYLFGKLNAVDVDSFCFLKKQKMIEPVFFMKEDKIIKLSSEEFYKIFDVEYLPSLYFSNLALLKKVIILCKKQILKGFIAEKETWLGIYFEEKLKKFSSAPVYIKWIDERKGFGLFAMRDLKENTFIGEYTGEVRKYRKRDDNKNCYCFEYKLGKHSSYTIDAKYMGNITRFINHGFSANLTTWPAYSDQNMHIIMKTNAFIPKDTELTYDYGPTYWKKREKPF